MTDAEIAFSILGRELVRAAESTAALNKALRMAYAIADLAHPKWTRRKRVRERKRWNAERRRR